MSLGLIDNSDGTAETEILLSLFDQGGLFSLLSIPL